MLGKFTYLADDVQKSRYKKINRLHGRFFIACMKQEQTLAAYMRSE